MGFSNGSTAGGGMGNQKYYHIRSALQLLRVKKGGENHANGQNLKYYRGYHIC